MVSSFLLKESNGVTGTTTTATNLNFGSIDSYNIVATNYPIKVDTNSYEKYVRGYFSGDFTKIYNVYFWKSAGDYVVGEAIKYKGDIGGTYIQPVNTTSVQATTAIPVSTPGSPNVTIGSSLSGSLTAAGYTDYIVLQKQIADTATPGRTNTLTFTMQWDEQ